MLLFKKTIPSLQHVKERYQTDIWAENYIKFRKNDNANYRYLFSYLDMVADLVAQQRPARVLDIGCGSGPTLRRIRERLPEAELVGVDISSIMLREVAPIPAAAGDAMALPFADHAFDITVCVAVSELFSSENFRILLSEAKRVTRPGGQLVILYRNRYSLWEPYWWFYKYPYYQNAYTGAEIRRITEAFDLPVEHVQGTYLAAPPIIYRNHQAFYRNWMPDVLLALIRRLDMGFLAKLLPFWCRHKIVVHRVPMVPKPAEPLPQRAQAAIRSPEAPSRVPAGVS